MSISAKLRAKQIGYKNAFYGKKHTEEIKAKIGAKNKGNKPVNRVKCSINGVIYESLGDASLALNIHVTTIRHRLHSKNKKFIEWCLV